jgi:hypothetical protein
MKNFEIACKIASPELDVHIGTLLLMEAGPELMFTYGSGA